MAKKSSKLADEEDIPTKKQTIEEVVEEAEVLKAQAEIEDDEAQKKQAAEDAEPEVEVDLDAEREKTKKETLDAIEKDVVEPIRKELINLKETLAPQEKDDYDKFVDDYTEKNGKAPEWKQVSMFLEERAVQRIKDEQKAETEAAKKAEDDLKATQEATATENFKVWQGQLQEMEDKGMLPKMEKPEEGDEGFDARVRLYANMQASWKTGTPITNLYEVYTKFYKAEAARGKQPAGGDAPVSLGSGGAGEDDTKSYTYDEIHSGGRDLEGFILKELQKVGVS